MTFPLMGLFSHTPYLFIVLLIFRSHVSSDDYSLSFGSDSSSVHTPPFVCSHLWLIHGLCTLPALNSVPIYSGRQSLSFLRFCQLRYSFSSHQTRHWSRVTPTSPLFPLALTTLLCSPLCVLRPALPVAPQHKLQTSVDCISGDRQGPP